MAIWKNYHIPRTIEDALRVLTQPPGPNRVIAGGTDLLLDLQQGRQAPVDALVDLNSIPELTRLEDHAAGLTIGAAVPLNRLTAWPPLEEHAQALLEAGSLVGGPQVRNTATLGGNVSHALPAADGTIALLALDAAAEIAALTPAGVARRRIPLERLFLGPGRSALAPGEILAAFHLPRRSGAQGSAFKRVMRPQGVAIAILNLAAWLQAEGDCIAAARIAVGPAGPTPLRARQAEQALAGQPFTPQTLAAGLQALLDEAHYRTSPHRAGADYRKAISAGLFEAVLAAAWQRAISWQIMEPSQ